MSALGVEYLAAMPVADVLKQPPESFRWVERRILASMPYKAREAWRLAHHRLGSEGMPREGWLEPDPTLLSYLAGLDIPVLQLFTAAAIAARGRG